MPRRFVPLCCALLTLAGPSAWGFEVKATIKSVDAEQRTIQFTAGQQERTVTLDADAKILDEKGEPLAAGLKSDALKPGVVVVLSIDRAGDQPLIRGIRLGGALAAVGQPRPNAKAAAQPAVDFQLPDTAKLVPLTDLGTGKYEGFEGGLYPDGANTRPASHGGHRAGGGAGHRQPFPPGGGVDGEAVPPLTIASGSGTSPPPGRGSRPTRSRRHFTAPASRFRSGRSRL